MHCHAKRAGLGFVCIFGHDGCSFTYDPKLPAYDILNLRVGVRREKWNLSFYVNLLASAVAPIDKR